MNVNTMSTGITKLEIQNDILRVISHPEFEWLLSSADVAKGYGISADALRYHKKEHADDLLLGKHFLSSVRIPHAASSGSSAKTFWTKRGIIRLGFFIKSKRARLFRDAAEDLILGHLQNQASVTHPEPQLTSKEEFFYSIFPLVNLPAFAREWNSKRAEQSLSDKLLEELARRDLSGMSTPQLLELISKFV